MDSVCFSGGWAGLIAAEKSSESFGDDLRKGGEDNIDIQPDIAVFQIIDIPLNSFAQFPFLVDFPYIVFNLGHSRHSGIGFVPEIVIWDETGIVFGMIEHMRPRTYDTHISQEDIEKLSGFVQMGFAKKSPYGGDPTIPFYGLLGVGFRIDDHGPE